MYLIYEAWCDPMENREDFGYNPVGYVENEDEAKEIVIRGGFVPLNKTWSLKMKPPQPRFKYERVVRFQSNWTN